MIALVIFLFALFVALGAGVLVCWSDFRSLTIPNIYPGAIIAAFIPAALAAHFGAPQVMGPVLGHLGAALIVLIISFILFSLRLFGGGDSKLLTAYALWAGFKGMAFLLFYMGAFGAVLGAVALIIKRRKPIKAPREGGWIDRLQKGENRVPYGIPIFIGAVVAFADVGFMDLAQLRLFLE